MVIASRRSSPGILVAALLMAAACSSVTVYAQAVRQSFDVSVPFNPQAVPATNGSTLTYEVHVANFARAGLTVTRLSVLDAASGAVLAVIERDGLRAAIGRVRTTTAEARAQIGPGEHAVVYVDLHLSQGTVPKALTHRVDFIAEGTPATTGFVLGGGVAITRRVLPTLSPPLRGGPWVAVYDPGLENGHRRFVYATEGSARVPGRHAIDWMKPLAAGGGKGPEGDGLGEDVLAVADAKVIASRDGTPEPPPGEARPRVPLADATGNYVALDIGNGFVAFYEHLLPGLRVKPGDLVRRGQVIGRLGSTGSASRPHLHFHLADRNSPLGAEGVPYLLAGWRQLGGYPSIQSFEQGGAWTEPAGVGPAPGPAVPAPNVVVTFVR